MNEPNWTHVFNWLGAFKSIQVDEQLLNMGLFCDPRVQKLDSHALTSDLTLIHWTTKREVQSIVSQLRPEQQLWVLPRVSRLPFYQNFWCLKSCDEAYDLYPSLNQPLQINTHAFAPQFMRQLQYHHRLSKSLLTLKVYAAIAWHSPSLFVFRGFKDD